jgi:ribosome-associated protein|tara:strand:+ start:97 stop:516 length:420 start_codon:yes stop_codon:yes gene_type:complete
MIPINTSITLTDAEIELTFSRSQGPGGQNVNKVNSKVTIHWDLKYSTSISAFIKRRIQKKHSNRINNDGKLVLSSQQHREQHRNREECYQKLRVIIADALKPRKTRKTSRPTRASKQRRLDSKKKRSRRKSMRQQRFTD